jgi:hypothetical protein
MLGRFVLLCEPLDLPSVAVPGFFVHKRINPRGVVPQGLLAEVDFFKQLRKIKRA